MRRLLSPARTGYDISQQKKMSANTDSGQLTGPGAADEGDVDRRRLHAIGKDEITDDDVRRRLHAIDKDEIKEEDVLRRRRRLSSCAHFSLRCSENLNLIF